MSSTPLQLLSPSPHPPPGVFQHPHAQQSHDPSSSSQFQPNQTHLPFASASTSASNSFGSTTSNQHTVPFGTSAATQSSALSFGFGSFGSASSLGNGNFGWGGGSGYAPSPGAGARGSKVATPPRSPFSPLGGNNTHQSIGLGFGGFQQQHGGIQGYNNTAGPSTSPFRTWTTTSSSNTGSGSGVRNKSPSPGPMVSLTNRRRRRSSSPLSDAGDEGDMMDTGTGFGRQSRQVKKMRKGDLRGGVSSGSKVGEGASSGGIGSGSNTSSRATSVAPEIDLGKALASLSKPSLLTLLNSLIQSQPSLTPLITSLLPPPTLTSVQSLLAASEKKILDSLPRGTGLREEYIWGRIRAPLDEFITEARSFMVQFCPTPNQLVNDELNGGGTGVNPQTLENHHPSTTFAFLHFLTLSMKRIESVLPRPSNPSNHHQQQQQQQQGGDPLSSHLLPLAINQWHILTTRLSSLVNQQGKILSAESVRGWFRQLDELCSPTYHHPGTSGMGGSSGIGVGISQKALEGLRERFTRELGWLVGIKYIHSSPSSTSSSSIVGQQQQQQQQFQGRVHGHEHGHGQGQGQGQHGQLGRAGSREMSLGDDYDDEEL